MTERYKELERAAQWLLQAWREYSPGSGEMRGAVVRLGEALSAETCAHQEAVFGCSACAARVRAKYPEFPLQVTRDVKVKPGPLSAPWPVAEKAWAAYAQQYGTGQSVERLAERGGFDWCEMDMFHPGWREEVDPFRRLEAERDEWRQRWQDEDNAARHAREANQAERQRADDAEKGRDVLCEVLWVFVATDPHAWTTKSLYEFHARAAGVLAALSRAVARHELTPDCVKSAPSSPTCPPVFTLEEVEGALAGSGAFDYVKRRLLAPRTAGAEPSTPVAKLDEAIKHLERSASLADGAGCTGLAGLVRAVLPVAKEWQALKSEAEGLGVSK